ncbi:putative 1-acylglycerol-3-phosphate O-acyltransferase [Helianthus annuus]|uniref:1-acylglycerol-3-phosphate O-acyltransferase n=1 Tax=Helianthus annuus TaxID=4232 RepID=A0A9K3HAB8_HELAN|nr:putative 1-acylglycerol-3-phosphate O-acyltransferase [Helianthus annuus]KAJ0847881.1 putative 1-acylglycerol-3-phosphate O-acyltransferase [Helianthus annuus]
MDPTSFTQTFTLSFSSLSLYIYPRISNTHRESLSLSLSASAMAIAASVVIVPIGVLFLVSGLIVNLLQSLFRRINRKVAELLWLELIWIVDWWSGVKVIFILITLS